MNPPLPPSVSWALCWVWNKCPTKDKLQREVQSQELMQNRDMNSNCLVPHIDLLTHQGIRQQVHPYPSSSISLSESLERKTGSGECTNP